jgi:DNA-binding NarL/FixJ family response regulator
MPGSRDSAGGWEADLPHVLTQLGVGILVCDASYHIQTASALGRAILRGATGAVSGDVLVEPLRSAVEDAALDCWWGSRAVRLGSTTLHVTVVPSRHNPGGWVVTLRREIVRDDFLRSRLRERHGITTRDWQILCMVRRGRRNREISTELGLTLGTVKSYVHRLFERVGVGSRGELLAAIEQYRYADGQI